MPIPVLDLRRTKCPLNFVKAKLAAEKLQAGESLELWLLSNGESAVNIPNSLKQEGFQVRVMQPSERLHSENVTDAAEAAILILHVSRVEGAS
jgi:TusA-related sulfurtransferase